MSSFYEDMDWEATAPEQTQLPIFGSQSPPNGTIETEQDNTNPEATTHAASFPQIPQQSQQSTEQVVPLRYHLPIHLQQSHAVGLRPAMPIPPRPRRKLEPANNQAVWQAMLKRSTEERKVAEARAKARKEAEAQTLAQAAAEVVPAPHPSNNEGPATSSLSNITPRKRIIDEVTDVTHEKPAQSVTDGKAHDIKTASPVNVSCLYLYIRITCLTK